MSGIEWTDISWNPIRGCTPISPGCSNCWAKGFARRLTAEGMPYSGEPLVTSTGEWTGNVVFDTKRLAEPLSWKRPRRVFVDSMSDLFHAGFTDNQIGEVFGVMRRCPHLTFQLLTKRPQRILGLKWLPNLDATAWPLPNVHLLVSCEDQWRFDERIPWLRECRAAVRGVSLEPLLEGIVFGSALSWLDWVIVGCESGHNRRPCEITSVLDVVRQCKAAGVPVFVKQISLPVRKVGSSEWVGRFSKKMHDWPTELRVRMYPGDKWQ